MRVLDLSTQIDGGYCTKLLCDAGAEVIKLESGSGGDPLRRWTSSGISIPEGEDGALFQFLHASKKSVCVDLEREEGRATVLQLAATVDVVIENFGPGAMERMGLRFEVLRKGNPQLSMVSISPWGQTGPWAHRPATEWTLQAAIGRTARRGLPERGPVGVGGRIGEWVAGTNAAIGALCAWRSARLTGKGQHVDVSMFETMLSCMTEYFDLAGQFTGKPLIQTVEVPSIERAKDGWVGFATHTSQQHRDFFTLIGHPEIAEDERFSTSDKRTAHFDLFERMIHDWTRERTVDEIIEIAALMRIPVGPIGTGETMPQFDQFAQRRVFIQNPGGFIQPRIPYQLECTPLRPLGRAPTLGEHTESVMKALLEQESHSSTAEEADEATLPFAGLRVIDLTAFWAGPYATEFLACMGADVVKVESIQRPDGMRFVNTLDCEAFWETGCIFHGANPGKRSITLQLDSDEGISILKRLLADADVVIENFSVRVMENFGLSTEVLRELNPRLIVVRMPAWGLDGPWRDRTGFAMNVEQACGIAWRSGYEDLPMTVNVCDPVGALHAVFALAMALEERQRSGRGQLVEVPLVEPGLNLGAEQVIEYSAYGELLKRNGNRGAFAAPQGVYRCAGEGSFVAMAVATDAQWCGLCAALGDPEWARAHEFARAKDRHARHDLIDEHLAPWFAARSPDEAVAQLHGAGVPAEPCINGHFVMPNPQLTHRQYYQELDHPVAGRRRYPGLPLRFCSMGPAWHHFPPPTLGQHNQEILGEELGYSKQELANLRERKIIGERPAWL